MKLHFAVLACLLLYSIPGKCILIFYEAFCMIQTVSFVFTGISEFEQTKSAVE